MSDDNEIAKILEALAKLSKLGKNQVTFLAALAIWRVGKKKVHPAERLIRWCAVTAFVVGVGYWRGLSS